MKMKIIPFDLEIAEKIKAGEIKGRIRTRCLKYICTLVESCVYTGHTCDEHLLLIKFPAHDFEKESLKVYHSNGRYMSDKHGDNWFDLVLEVPDEASQFEPFDKVLVRKNDTKAGIGDIFHRDWTPAIYQECSLDPSDKYPYLASGMKWKDCIPYKGNEHLLGTTNEPKEE